MGTRTVSQTINLQNPGISVSKYITEITGAGIKVAATNPSTASNYIQITGDAVDIVADNTHKTTISSTKMDVYVGDTTNSAASFGASSVRVGKITEGHVLIRSNGIDLNTYSNSTLINLAHFGYAEGQAESGTAIAPYYTLGVRASGSAVGNYSVAEGYETTASSYISHAEGYSTTASGMDSHAEGFGTTASGDESHAEGFGTTASGDESHAEGHGTTASGDESHAEGHGTTASGNNGSHAEGYDTTASGSVSHAEGLRTTASGHHSHAQNNGTKASSNNQTALGKYNIDDNANTYALIIGNGTSESTRSNALAVTWDGNVHMAIDNYQISENIDKDIYDSIISLGWSDVLI